MVRRTAEGALHVDAAGRWYRGDGFLGVAAGIATVHQPGADASRFAPLGALCAEGGSTFASDLRLELALRVCGRFGEVATQERTNAVAGADVAGWVGLGGAFGGATLSARLGLSGGALLHTSGDRGTAPRWYASPTLGLALGFR
ncbi:MAG: hypothetical protein AB8I08_20750 [Sandaracinaceae bacterium]